LCRSTSKSSNLLNVSLVTTAAMLAFCLLALVGTTMTAGASSFPQNGKIAFVGYPTSGTQIIYTVEPDSSNPRTLTTFGTRSDVESKWSPDGTKIAISDGKEISVLDADGSNLRNIPTKNIDDLSDIGITWSPDGTKLAFTYYPPRRDLSDISTMDLDGSNRINLTKTRRIAE
jgi:hypothetical protein